MPDAPEQPLSAQSMVSEAAALLQYPDLHAGGGVA